MRSDRYSRTVIGGRHPKASDRYTRGLSSIDFMPSDCYPMTMIGGGDVQRSTVILRRCLVEGVCNDRYRRRDQRGVTANVVLECDCWMVYERRPLSSSTVIDGGCAKRSLPWDWVMKDAPKPGNFPRGL